VTEQPSAAREPRRARPSRRGRLWTVLLLFIIASGLAAYYSPALRAHEFQIVGADHLSHERVLEIAGVALGDARWEHPARSVQARLLKEPWVKTAQVTWSWNQVRIVIQERASIGLLPYQTRYVALDETGQILELVESASGQHLPVITGVHTSKALRGQQLSNPGLSDALLVLMWMAEPLRAQVEELNVNGERNLTLYMTNHASVRWGTVYTEKDPTTSVREKLKMLGDVWSKVPKPRAADCRIDLRIAGRAIPTSGCE